MSSYRRNAGFTLLETILSLALTALLVGMMATLARQWLINWNRGADRMEQIESVSLAENRLAREIGNAISLAFHPANTLQSFIGRPNEIYFVRAPNAAEKTANLVVVNYRNDAERGIIRRTANYNVIRPLEEQSFTEAVTLLPAPYRMELVYQSADGRSDAAWQSRNLPSTVQVAIAAENGRRFTPVSIEILAPLSALCGRAGSMRDCLAIAENGKLPPPTPVKNKNNTNRIQDNTGQLKP